MEVVGRGRSVVLRRAFATSSASTQPGVLRSFLFVPGREDLLNKALAKQLSPDVLVPDMEDSVPESPKDKTDARRAIAQFLPRFAQQQSALASRVHLLPRVNAVGSDYIEEDLEAVIGPHILGVSIGKVASVEDIKYLDSIISKLEQKQTYPSTSHSRPHTRIVPWIETAAGVARALDICQASPRILGVAFGADDFLTDMGISSATSDTAASSFILNHARSAIALAARAAGIAALETPFINFKSTEGLAAASRNALSLGYQGMFAIHPSQVDDIRKAFSPSDADIAHSKRIVEAYEKAQKEGKGSTSLDGKMIDAPVVKRAYRLLASL